MEVWLGHSSSRAQTKLACKIQPSLGLEPSESISTLLPMFILTDASSVMWSADLNSLVWMVRLTRRHAMHSARTMNQTPATTAASLTLSPLDASSVDSLLQATPAVTPHPKSSEATLPTQLKVPAPTSTQITPMVPPEHATREVTSLPTRIRRMVWKRTTSPSK